MKITGSWPGKVVIVACEPQTFEEMGMGLTPVVEEAVDRAVKLVLETAKEHLTDEAYAAVEEKP
jgi:Ni,Fe-hydrogenase maturation factor